MKSRIAMLLALGGSASMAAAQAGTPTPVPAPTTRTTPVVVTSRNPRRDTLAKFMHPVTVDFKETRLEDAMRFIQDVTQADIEVMWADDKHPTGLDREVAITLKFDRGTALDLLEHVLEKAGADAAQGGGNTWQMSNYGTMQVGTKDRLNHYKRVKIYSVADLMVEVPNYTDAPTFDLQQVLQNSGQGGGGGQSPFKEATGAKPILKTPEQKTEELIQLITSLVEPEQWVENGGDGASVRAYQTNLIINAPDYIHRAIDGYDWWPQQDQRVAMTKTGHRYVTLGGSYDNSTLDGFNHRDITAVVGGRLVNSGDPHPPGGQAHPGTPAKPAPTAPASPSGPK